MVRLRRQGQNQCVSVSPLTLTKTLLCVNFQQTGTAFLPPLTGPLIGSVVLPQILIQCVSVVAAVVTTVTVLGLVAQIHGNL